MNIGLRPGERSASLACSVPLLEEPQGFVDHLVFGVEQVIFEEGPDNLLPVA